MQEDKHIESMNKRIMKTLELNPNLKKKKKIRYQPIKSQSDFEQAFQRHGYMYFQFSFIFIIRNSIPSEIDSICHAKNVLPLRSMVRQDLFKICLEQCILVEEYLPTNATTWYYTFSPCFYHTNFLFRLLLYVA